jgi:uncharacterized membrane protein YadS
VFGAGHQRGEEAVILGQVGRAGRAASPLHVAAEFLIVMALTAVGLSANLRRMASTGVRPILLGLGVWAAVAVSSLAVQLAMGQL